MEPDNNDLVYQGETMYATFWSRVGAILLDNVILSPTVIVFIYNSTDWKSNLILILSSLFSLCYKSFWEYRYGATPGKMVFGLTVVGYDYEKPSLNAILLRNIFQLSTIILITFFTLKAFNKPEFIDIRTYREYRNYMNNTPIRIVRIIGGLITIVDVIYFSQDEQNQTLHDRIGWTYVVKRIRPSNQ